MAYRSQNLSTSIMKKIFLLRPLVMVLSACSAGQENIVMTTDKLEYNALQDVPAQISLTIENKGSKAISYTTVCSGDKNPNPEFDLTGYEKDGDVWKAINTSEFTPFPDCISGRAQLGKNEKIYFYDVSLNKEGEYRFGFNYTSKENGLSTNSKIIYSNNISVFAKPSSLENIKQACKGKNGLKEQTDCLSLAASRLAPKNPKDALGLCFEIESANPQLKGGQLTDCYNWVIWPAGDIYRFTEKKSQAESEQFCDLIKNKEYFDACIKSMKYEYTKLGPTFLR
jgi:hypothetical protein